MNILAVTRKIKFFRTKNFLIPLSIFALVIIVLGVPRSEFSLIVTDTDYIGIRPLNFSEIKALLIDDTYPEWYRPLEYMIISKELEVFDDWATMIFIQSAIPAITAVVIYFLMLEFTKKRWLAWACAIIYSFDMSVIETTWLFLHKVVLADFFVILGIFSLIRYLKTSNKKWLALLWGCIFIGPLIREISAVLPLIALVTIILLKKKDLKLFISFSLLTIHAIFPSFVFNMIIEQNVVLLPIFERNFVGISLQEGIRSFNFDIPILTSLHFSPFVTILLLISISLFLILREKWSILIGIGVLFQLRLTILYWQNPDISELTLFVPLIFALVVSISGFRFGKILPVWFILPMIPFFVIPAHVAWLKMAALPFLIITLLWIDQLPQNIRNACTLFSKRKLNLEPISPILIVSVILIFTMYNVEPAFQTFTGMIETHQEIAKWLTNNAQNNSVLLTNIRQNYDT